MPEPTRMDNRTLLRRTLITAGAMVGACVFFVGTLTLVTLGVVGHAVGSGDATDSGGIATQPPTGIHPAPAGAKPLGGRTATPRN